MADTVENLVRRFYEEAWNRWDDTVVDALLAEDFVFRGSLGDEVRGRDGWRGPWSEASGGETGTACGRACPEGSAPGTGSAS
jgi:hypothetical protein